MKYSTGATLYAYVDQNPINFIDPLGLFSTADFVWHYYFGNGIPIDLGQVGLLDTFKNAGSVRASTFVFQAHVREAAIEKAKSLCSACGQETISANFNLRDQDETDVTSEPNLFAVGGSTFFRSAGCHVRANCSTKTCSYNCALTFAIRDWFRDPVGLGIELLGTIYRINASWAEDLSGNGEW